MNEIMEDMHFFIHSGDHPKLARAELHALVKSYHPNTRLQNFDERVSLIYGRLSLQKISSRTAYTKYAGRLLKLSDLDFDINGYPMNCKKFACKLINLSDKHANMESLTSIGKYIKERYPWMRVSLENPDVTVLYIVTNSGSLVGIVDYNSHRLKQSARSRPYFHPVALEPRLSRVMINLTMCKENDLLLDPFCGTGSILLDAAAMNIRTIGCDISEKMCYGALANAGMNSAIVNCDALSLPLQLKFVDGIATDLPYGRAASTMKRSAKKLLEDFVSLVSEMKGKRCCVMCRKGDEQLFDNIVEQYDIYEHRNLTRNLMVLCS